MNLNFRIEAFRLVLGYCWDRLNPMNLKVISTLPPLDSAVQGGIEISYITGRGLTEMKCMHFIKCLQLL